MCGIVGFTGNKKSAPILLEGLSKLEYRGYDSAGIAVLNDGTIKTQKTAGRIKSLMDNTNGGETINGSVGIGHTRWATHGAPTTENAHPHLSGNKKFAVVHNGIIENYSLLKENLINDGFEFLSETDTEVIPHLLEKYYDGDIKTTVIRVTNMLKGSYALGIICADYPHMIIAAKKFSPLIIGVSSDCNIIASDATAIVNTTKDIIYLEDGEIAFIQPDNIEIIDENQKKIQKEITTISWNVAAAEKDGFEHFMMKEIFEQPKSVANALNGRIKNKKVVFENFKLSKEELQRINMIKIVACGSAYHAGMVGKYILEDMTRIPCEVDLASEFRYRNPIVNDKTLTIVISQSGETADTLAALKKAKSSGSHILAIVNVVGSSIAKLSDDVIYTYAGPEIAVATTKGYSTQLAALYLFSAWCAQNLGTISANDLEYFLNSVKSLPQKIKETIDCCGNIKKISKICIDSSSLFFMGRNLDYAVALEASLKLKEISYIHSEAYAAGELKHGTISLIEKGKIVIALSCYSDLSEKMSGNIKEVVARGANIISCTNEKSPVISNQYITIPDIDSRLIASLEIIPFQLFAYYVAYYKGLDIDKPRNLAKSVTVE